MAVLGLFPNQWAAVAMRARVVMAVPVTVRKELQPFWSMVLMALHDEMKVFISWLWLCVMQGIAFGVWKGEHRGEPPFKRFFKHRNDE
jgi:hypothetical protein